MQTLILLRTDVLQDAMLYTVTLGKKAAGSYKQELSVSLHGATFQMTDIVIFTTMKTYSQQAS